MSKNLLPNIMPYFHDGNGNPNVGGKVWTYQAGSQVLKDSFTDFVGNTTNANPVILDSAGYPDSGGIWLTPDEPYKIVVMDSNDVVLYSVDNVLGTGSGSGGTTGSGTLKETGEASLVELDATWLLTDDTKGMGVANKDGTYLQLWDDYRSSVFGSLDASGHQFTFAGETQYRNPWTGQLEAVPVNEVYNYARFGSSGIRHVDFNLYGRQIIDNTAWPSDGNALQINSNSPYGIRLQGNMSTAMQIDHSGQGDAMLIYSSATSYPMRIFGGGDGYSSAYFDRGVTVGDHTGSHIYGTGNENGTIRYHAATSDLEAYVDDEWVSLTAGNKFLDPSAATAVSTNETVNLTSGFGVPGTYVKIPLTTDRLSDGITINTTTDELTLSAEGGGRYFINLDGLYYFLGTVVAGDHLVFRVFVNGTQVDDAVYSMDLTPGQDTALAGGWILDLAANDVIDIRVAHSSTAPVTADLNIVSQKLNVMRITNANSIESLKDVGINSETQDKATYTMTTGVKVLFKDPSNADYFIIEDPAVARRIQVDGSLLVGADTAATPIDGTIQHADIGDGPDLVGRVNGEWLSLTKGGSGTSTDVNQVAHGFTVLTPVYYSSGTWIAAKSDAEATLATHIIVEVKDADNFVAASEGRFEVTAHGLTQDEYYFTDDTTAGTLTATEPSTYSNPMLRVFDANFIDVFSWRPSTSAGGGGGGGGGAGVSSVTGADNIIVDNTDPANPIVKADLDQYPFNPVTTAPTRSEGTVYYDDNKNSLVMMGDTAIDLQIGHHNFLQVYNNTGSTITKGTPLYVSGGFDNNGNFIAEVERARANAQSTCRNLCVALDDILNLNIGQAINQGKFDTDLTGFAEGDILFVDASAAGVLTNVEPAYPFLSAKIGRVLEGGVNGTLLVQPDTDPQYSLSGTSNFPPAIQLSNISQVQNIGCQLYKVYGAGIKPTIDWNGSGSPSTSIWDNGQCEPLVSAGGILRTVSINMAGAAVNEATKAATVYARVEIWQIRTSSDSGPVKLTNIDVPITPRADIGLTNNLGSANGVSGSVNTSLSIPAGDLFGVLIRASSQFSGGNSYLNSFRNTIVGLSIY